MEDVIEVVIIGGRVRCIYLNDYRIAGSKPYVSEAQGITTFKLPVGVIRQHLKRKSKGKQCAPVAPDLTELREYHAKAVKDLEHYADDSGLRESDVKHYRKRAEFHAKQVALIDSLKS